MTRYVLKLLIAFLAAFVSLPFASAQLTDRQTEADLLESYLRSQQLNELVIEHVEAEVAREQDVTQRLKLAQKLVNLYSEEMMAGRDSHSNWQLKSEHLLLTYPKLATPSIRLAILQSKYQNAEKEFRDWWSSGQLSESKSDVVDQWREINDELKTLNLRLEQEYQDRLASIQASPDNREFESKQILRTEGLLLHTNYLIGWTAYFRGILDTNNRKDLMRESDRHFREFLQIEPNQTLTDLSPKWIDYSSDWNTRALVGLALCQRGLNHVEQSKFCFDLIENHASNPKTRDLRFYWDLNGWLYLGDFSKTSDVVDEVNNSKSLSRSGEILFWQELLKSSMAIRKRAPGISAKLFYDGLAGLGRNFQAEFIQEFLDRHSIALDETSFTGQWISGYLVFANVESGNAKELLPQATSLLNGAIKAANSRTNVLNLACCKFLLARIDFQQMRYESAANSFESVSVEFEDSSPELSAEAQLLAITCWSALSKQKPRFAFRANRAIEQAMLRFPGTQVAKQAKFERMRINHARLTPEQAIKKWRRIQPEDSTFHLALKEIIQIQYQSWLEAFENQPDEASQFKEQLIFSEAEYQRLSKPNNESKLRVGLLLIDALLRDDQVPNADIRRRLNVSRTVAKGATNPSLINEYRFYEFQFAVRLKDQELVERHAEWLCQNAKGTRFELSALIQLAKTVDVELHKSTAPDKELLNSAIQRFKNLLEVLGTTDESLRTSANARIAFARLSELEQMAGNTKDSILMLQRLNQLFPRHKDYLRQLATTLTQSSQFDLAKPIWKKIAAGVDAGSDSWFEAKYNLVVCLNGIGDREQAEQLCKQTIRIGGDMPQKWKTQFNEMAESFQPANVSNGGDNQ